MRSARFAYSRTLAVKNNDDLLPAPILIITQLLKQGLTRERWAATMKFAQFGPGKNDAVAVNNEVIRAHPVS